MMYVEVGLGAGILALLILLMGGMGSGAVVGAVVIGVLFTIIDYVALPAMSLNYSDMLAMALVVLVFTFVVAIIRTAHATSADKERKRTRRYDSLHDDNKAPTPPPRDVAEQRWVSIAASIILFGLLAVGWFFYSMVASSEMFNADAYYKMLGPVTERKLNADLAPVDIKSIRQVTEETAMVNVARTMGNDPGLGSRVTVGDKTTQRLNGCFTARLLDNSVQKLCFDNELVYASALEQSGFQVWRHNATTPGYTLSSAVNPDKFFIITGLVPADAAPAAATPAAAANGKMGASAPQAVDDKGVQPIALRYLPSAYLGDNLERYVYEHGYSNVGITDLSFEVNDSGRPFYVVTLYANTLGFSAPQATGILVVDPQTGDITRYGLTDAPAWVERVQPESFIIDQLTWWAEYAKGYSNTAWWGAQDGVQKPTAGDGIVEGADGQLYIYTGISSIGNDNSTSGFMLVNTRTKESRFYSLGGATENAARVSAQDANTVKNNHYTAAFPVMYEINGVPTYFMPLLDSSNLAKAYAFVNVEQHGILGVGDTWQQALRAYQNNLVSRGQAVNGSDVVTAVQLTAAVQAITSELAGEKLTYYLLLQGQEGREYSAPTDLSAELKWTKPGDQVTVTAEQGVTGTVPLVKFDNPRVGLKP